MPIAKKILLADDDVMFAAMYHKAIQDAGFIVTEVHNGEDAARIALAEKPDLVILDMNMPKKDGLSVLKEIRETDWGKNLPVIILTGNDTKNSDIPQLTVLHPTYYILKGSETMDKFVEKIQELTRI